MTIDAHVGGVANDEFRPPLQQAQNCDTPIEILVCLANSKDELVRGAVASNRATPEQIIDQLLNDSSSYVLRCLRKRGFKTGPVFIKPNKVIGNNIFLRNATEEDAAFILQLRTDEVKSKNISKVPNDLNRQVAWLRRYANDSQQIYFIICSKDDQRVGTVRLYDKIEDSFCWGSWILKASTPSSYSIESALLVYHFALSLGFTRAHFDVRKENLSVWKFHERFGAIKVTETREDFIYNIFLDAIESSLSKYKKYLPNGAVTEGLGASEELTGFDGTISAA